MEINSLIKELRKAGNNTEEQENCLKYLLESEKYLEEYIHKTSGECKDLLDAFSQTVDSVFDSSATSNKQLDLNESNICLILECIVQTIELCQSKYGSLTLNDLNKQVSSSLCATLMKKYFTNVFKKSLFLKLSTKPTLDFQIQCVKFLGLCIKENKSHLKQIAIEFNYFQDKKTWLDKYIHQNNSYNLRVESVKFLLSFLNYANDIEIQIIIRKIFIQQHTSNVIQSLFSTLGSNQRELIETVLEEFLFKVIKSNKYTKSDKVRLFNERNLLSLVKLYNWKGVEEDEKNTEGFYEMLTEFLKILFCSTQYGISFYDRTLGIQLTSVGNNAGVNISAKNLNHLIFNSIVSVQTITRQSQLDAFNNILLNVFKVCPDLIQRFFKYKFKQLQQQSMSSEDNDKSGLMSLNWLVDFSILLFEQQKHLISKHYFLKRYINESTYSSIDYICELIIQTSIPISIPLIRLMANKSALLGQRFKYINLLIKCLGCLNEWKTCLSAPQTNLKFLEKNSAAIMFNLNQQLFMNKYLPTLDLLNINDIIPADSVIGSEEIVQLIDLYSFYFDLILNDNLTNGDNYAIQNMLQIEYINQKFLVNLTNLMLDKVELKLSTAESFMKFLLHFLKLKQLYDTNENFEAIISELVYKLIKLFIKYGYNNQEEFLNSYIKFIEISFMKLIQLNERNEFNESLFQLWFILFHNFVVRDADKNGGTGNESEMNFFIDYADCCLKNFFNFKINNLFLESSGSSNSEIKKIFFQSNTNSDCMEIEDDQQDTDLSALLLFECSIKTYLQFKGRFGEDNAIIGRILEFLNSFLLKALLIQTNAHELNNIKAYIVQKGFQSVLDTYCEFDVKPIEAHHQILKSIESNDFNVIKIKNLLSLIHRSIETANINEVLLECLYGLCKQEDENKCEKMCKLVLNDSIIKNNCFKKCSLIKLLINLAEISENFASKDMFDDYLENFLVEIHLNECDEWLDTCLKLVSKLKNLKETFLSSLSTSKRVYLNQYYPVILLRNRDTIINNENLRLFESCFKHLLKFLTKSCDEDSTLNIKIDELDSFLCDCYNFKPNLCHYLSRSFVRKAKKINCLSKFAPKFVELISSTTVSSEKCESLNNNEMIVDGDTDDEDSAANFNTEYTYTLSRKDQVLLQNKFKNSKNLNFLKFMHNFNEDEDVKKQTHLNIEVKLNDFINEKINSEVLEKSILNFQVSRKISNIVDVEDVKFENSEIYDPVYLLANFYALLHYGQFYY